MRIGISSIVTEAKLSVFEGLKALAEVGFECVDFSVCNYSMPHKRAHESFLLENWHGFAERISQTVSSLGMSVGQIHGTWGQTTDLTSYEAPASLLYRQMQIAKILGTDTMVLHPVLPARRVESTAQKKAYIDYNVRWFSEIAEQAEQHGVTVAMENVFADGGNYPAERLYPFTTADTLLEVADRVDSERIGFCLDFGHANLEWPDRIEELVAGLGNRIKALHINENVGRICAENGARIPMDLHMLPLGTRMNTERIMKALRNVSYRGDVSLEIVDRSASVGLMYAQLHCAVQTARYYRDILTGTIG